MTAVAIEQPNTHPAASDLEAVRDTRACYLVLWVIPIALGAAVSFAPAILNDGDTFWHLAAGRWMIAHGAVPATDPFSYTFVGRPWMAHEWLSEVAMAGARRAAGWSGVMLLTGLAAGALAALMGGWLLRWLSPLSAIAALALGLACVAPGALARPHFLALPVLALWTARLLDARERGRAPSLWLALVMALWANLHSSFIVGLLLAGAFALEALLDVRLWRARMLGGWAAFLALSLAAALATPHGVEGLAFPLRVLNMKTLPAITEWLGPDFMRPTTLEVAVLAGLLVAFWRGVRLTAVRALILVGLLHMSLQHVRQEVLLGVVAPLMLAGPLGRALGRTEPRTVRWAVPAPQAALAAVLVLAAISLRLLIPEVRVDGPTAPVTALARVPAALRGEPVLNDYDFGGYLIFEGVRPYIDGRADMYGDAFVADDDAIQRASQSAMDAAIARYRIRWAILRPDRPLTTALARTPGWKRTYADKYAVVLVNAGSGEPTRSSSPPGRVRPSSAHG
jgi:hypothetical protein